MKKGSTRTATTAHLATKTKKPQPTATAKGDEIKIADGRQVQSALQKHFRAIAKHDKARKTKLFSAELLAEMGTLIRTATTAVTARRLGAEKKSGAVAGAALVLAQLIEMVSANRDIIEVTHSDDAALQRGFGRGNRLRTVEDALAMSSLQQQTCEDDVLGPRARDAGFTPAAMKALIEKRRELVAATTGKTVVKGTTKGLQLDKKAAIRQLVALTVRGRKVAKIVFKGQPKILAEFESTLAKRKRPAKTPGAQPQPKSVTPPAAVATQPNGSPDGTNGAARKLTVTATASE